MFVGMAGRRENVLGYPRCLVGSCSEGTELYLDRRYEAQIQKIVRALETSKPCLFIKDIYFDPLFCSCYDAGSVCDIQQREQAARMGPCTVRQGAGA